MPDELKDRELARNKCIDTIDKLPYCDLLFLLGFIEALANHRENEPLY